MGADPETDSVRKLPPALQNETPKQRPSTQLNFVIKRLTCHQKNRSQPPPQDQTANRPETKRQKICRQRKKILIHNRSRDIKTLAPPRLKPRKNAAPNPIIRDFPKNPRLFKNIP
jgi:hypothetical protein